MTANLNVSPPKLLPAWSKEQLGLEASFPGIHQQLQNTMNRTAAIMFGEPLRVWHTIKLDPQRRKFVAYVHMFIAGRGRTDFPVIPDQHNPHPDKLIGPNDTPYGFGSWVDANTFGLAAAQKLLKSMLDDEEDK